MKTNNDAMNSFKDMELQIRAINLAEKYDLPTGHVSDFVKYYLDCQNSKADDDMIVSHFLRRLLVDIIRGTKKWE